MRKIGTQTNSSSEDLSWLLEGMRKGRSYWNTSYREVTTQLRSGRRGGELPEEYEARHGDGAGNWRRR